MDWIRGRGNEYIITAREERERGRKIFEENVIKKFLFVYSYRRYYVYPSLMNIDILGLRNFENYYLCMKVKTVHFFHEYLTT
jgi:DNA-binding Lrp family transcriptional regulator